MNRENVEYCISLMENAKNLCMQDYYIGNNDCNTIEELHACNNTACFMGYVGLSEKFKEDGGDVFHPNIPILTIDGEEYDGHYALAKWLDIDVDLAHQFVMGVRDENFCYYRMYTDPNRYSPFYAKPWDDVKPQDVIEKLKLLLSGELS